MQSAHVLERPHDTTRLIRDCVASGHLQQEHLVQIIELVNKCRIGRDAGAVAEIFREIASLLEADISLETCIRCYEGCSPVIPFRSEVGRSKACTHPPRRNCSCSPEAMEASDSNEKTIVKVEQTSFVICYFSCGYKNATCLLGTSRYTSTCAELQLLMIYLLPHLHSMCLRIGCGPRGLSEDALKAAITARELDVLYWIAQGKTNWEIGRILHISERTVKFHLKNIFDKLGVVNRAQAVLKARDVKLLPQSISKEFMNGLSALP